MKKYPIIVCLFAMLAAPVWGADSGAAKIKADVSIQIGSGTLVLPAGATVRVLSIRGEKATVSYTGPDNSPVITQVKASDLDLIPAAPPVVAAPPSPPVPPPAPAPSVPPAASANNSAAAAASINVAPAATVLSTDRTLEQSLALAGANRPELEKFLAANKSPEAAMLIQKARQTDLVHLTGQLLSDNLALTEKARTNAKWSSRVPPEIWQEFVLPYRVADEPLDDFKPEFFPKLASVVGKIEESGDAAVAVHDWYWKGNAGGPWVSFKVSESRDQPPRVLFNDTKIGRCFEMNMLCVALLRSAGVPARIAGTSFWMNDEFYHYWVEYYDTKSKSWLYYEGANPDVDSMMGKSFLHKGGRVYATAYALPGYCPISDPIGKERWDVLINTTPLYLSCGTLHCQATVRQQDAPVFTVYSWNLSTWRSVAQATANEQGQADITVYANDGQYPYLVSTAVGGNVYWQTVNVVANQSTDVNDLTMDTHPAARVVLVAQQNAKDKNAGGTTEK